MSFQYQQTEQTAQAKPTKRWFRLKFKDGRIERTDFASAQKAQACIDWYKANLPGSPYCTAAIVELSKADHTQSVVSSITRTIGPRNAAIFLGGK